MLESECLQTNSGLTRLYFIQIKNYPMEEYEKDEEVLSKSLENPRLFELLVDKYRDVFLRTAGRILKNQDETEDVVQDTFVKIYFNARKFQKRPGIEFKSWAFRILINCAFTRYRKLKKTFQDKEYLDELLYIPSDDMDVLERKEARDEIKSIMARMPEDLAGFLQEHYLEDKPYEEIVRSSGMSINALKMKLFRARKSFKKVKEEIG